MDMEDLAEEEEPESIIDNSILTINKHEGLYN